MLFKIAAQQLGIFISARFMKRWWRFLIIACLGIVLSLRFNQSLLAQAAPSQLVQQAQIAYQTGDFDRSIKLLNRAIEVYRDRDRYLQQAQILALTSLAQQQIGKWQLAKQNLIKSMALTEVVPSSKNKTQILGQIWNARGHYEFSKGNDTQALAAWKQSQQLYDRVGDSLGVAGSKLDRALVLSQMGFYDRACNVALETLNVDEYSCQELFSDRLKKIIETATVDTQPWTISALNRIANNLLLMGNSSQAIALIEASQAISASQKLSSPLAAIKTQLSLGNINKEIAFRERSVGNRDSFTDYAAKAVKYYQQVIDRPISNRAVDKYKISAQLNLLSLYVATEQWLPAQRLVKQINWQDKSNLYAPLKFAEDLQRLKQNKIEIGYSWQSIAEIYLDTIERAKIRGDRRIQSYSLGNLGILQTQQPLNIDSSPQQLLEEALSLSQQIQASEIGYRWQWKLGQIYRQQNRREIAIASYQASLATLANLRSDLAILSQEIQFDFREQIEPIYRELVDLLLATPDNSNEDLENARNTIEALQVAELDNYFQDACLMFEQRNIEAIDLKAAIIYTIVLPDRLEVIMEMGNSNSGDKSKVLHHHTALVSQRDLESTVSQLRQYISEPDRTLKTQELSAQIYDWLIKPFAADFAAKQPETLVFVLDSILQPIPMSVLYDGQQYLIEKYALALTPGLRLLKPQTVDPQTAYVGGGVTKSLQVGDRQFSPLNNVKTELTALSKDSSIILNREFTANNLLQQINDRSASRIHIATHGQFSSDPNRTFLLMWQKLLTIKQFSQILLKRNQIVTVPIDLLVLSACDTASGDRRAALGLAGIAVRSGALSTVATLWQINDESTAVLMKHFYQNLKLYPNKAKALQLAQLALWQTEGKDWQIPAFWSSYILIGNW